MQRFKSESVKKKPGRAKRGLVNSPAKFLRSKKPGGRAQIVEIQIPDGDENEGAAKPNAGPSTLERRRRQSQGWGVVHYNDMEGVLPPTRPQSSIHEGSGMPMSNRV